LRLSNTSWLTAQTTVAIFAQPVLIKNPPFGGYEWKDDVFATLLQSRLRCSPGLWFFYIAGTLSLKGLRSGAESPEPNTGICKAGAKNRAMPPDNPPNHQSAELSKPLELCDAQHQQTLDTPAPIQLPIRAALQSYP